MIAVASISDTSRAAALLRSISSDRLYTEAGLRHRMEVTASPENATLYWKAELDGELIGWAAAGRNVFATSTTDGFGTVAVAVSHRRRGVGTALWDVVEAHLADVGVRRPVVYGEADPGSVAFARSRGFTLGATQTFLKVDPRTIEAPAALPAGLRLCPFRALADDPRPVYDADFESILDEPSAADFSGVTFETWKRHFWDHPDCDRELGTAVLVDGEVVGLTFVMADRDHGVATNAGTSVRRAFRGRGLAMVMKRHSLATAARAGIQTVVTENDESNAAMVTINERLGYEPFSRGHSWVLDR